MHIGGEGGIRTHGTVTRTTVFETAKVGHGDRSGYTSLENRTIKMQTTLVACPGFEPTRTCTVRDDRNLPKCCLPRPT